MLTHLITMNERKKMTSNKFFNAVAPPGMP